MKKKRKGEKKRNTLRQFGITLNVPGIANIYTPVSLEQTDIKIMTYLQIRARISPLPVANRLPVGLGATEMTVNNMSKASKDKDKRQLTRVLVALKHHLGIASHRVPELDTAVLGTTHHPSSVGGQTHTENKVLQTLGGGEKKRDLADKPCDLRKYGCICRP